MALNKRFMVQVRSSVRLEVPIAVPDGSGLKLLVDEAYLRLLVEIANSKFDANTARVQRFFERVQQAFPAADSADAKSDGSASSSTASASAAGADSKREAQQPPAQHVLTDSRSDTKKVKDALKQRGWLGRRGDFTETADGKLEIPLTDSCLKAVLEHQASTATSATESVAPTTSGATSKTGSAHALLALLKLDIQPALADLRLPTA